ncbi:MAG: HPr family phosphocarrier protein [Lachnospiraceae bacterium]|nr:HPr family phosphocarrier protein [Lachnospiraceae bacterium]MDO5348735.1 HPr family phosphocarrier protein [Lachnospiraceae bacterium]
MVSKTLTVVNPSGLHLRPAGVLSQTAMKFKCDVIIECGEKRIVAKSVLNVMAAGIKCGTEINLICDGEDENDALATLSKAIEDGLGEK